MIGGKGLSCIAVDCSDVDKKSMLAENFLYIGVKWYCVRGFSPTYHFTSITKFLTDIRKPEQLFGGEMCKNRTHNVEFRLVRYWNERWEVSVLKVFRDHWFCGLKAKDKRIRLFSRPLGASETWFLFSITEISRSI